MAGEPLTGHYPNNPKAADPSDLSSELYTTQSIGFTAIYIYHIIRKLRRDIKRDSVIMKGAIVVHHPLQPEGQQRNTPYDTKTASLTISVPPLDQQVHGPWLPHKGHY